MENSYPARSGGPLGKKCINQCESWVMNVLVAESSAATYFDLSQNSISSSFTACRPGSAGAKVENPISNWTAKK